MNDKDIVIQKILDQIKQRFQDRVISIFGIGSYFDKTLGDDWISNDIDIIVVLNDLKRSPKHDWTTARYEILKIKGYKIWVGYSTTEALKKKELFQKLSFSNYEWSIIELKYPQNSELLYGKNIRDQLPDPNQLEFDFDDIFRRSLYHLDKSYKVEVRDKNVEKSKFQFTKAVFKFCFYLSLYHDPKFRHTTLKRITERINELRKGEVIASKILIILEVCVLFRRGKGFIKDFHSLRSDFTEFILSQLGKGNLHREMDYRQLFMFLRESFGGLTFLMKILKKAKKRHQKEKMTPSIISQDEIKEISKKVYSALFSDVKSVSFKEKQYNIARFSRSGLRHVDIGRYRFVEQNPNKHSVWAQKARQGDQILWIFKENDYYARIVNGEFKLL
jgi:hypothetical protein